MALDNDINGKGNSIGSSYRSLKREISIRMPGRETFRNWSESEVPIEFLEEDILMENLPPQATTKDEDEPQDETLTSCLFFEPPVAAGNISLPGLHFIANHKYRPSDYTHLDNLLNPMWAYLTELLPMWLAPNMVTTLGGLHCGVAYALLWWYSPDFDHSPPDWVVFLAGWCTWAYYTLDCMDGKQARRTGSSSPLGQLFDHGFDCICSLFFMATTGSYLMIGGTHWYILLQTSASLAFFMAQWEEYHTHVLPHCTGKWCGVSEVNYSLGLIAFVNSCLDREVFYQRSMKEVLAPLGDSALQHLPTAVKDMELRYFLLSGWGIMSVTLMLLSLKRVMTHPRIAGNPADKGEKRLAAISKLATPFLLCVAAFIVPPDAVRTRYISVSVGLAMSLLTKKMIVFSMAKMAFAMVQWEAIPLLLASLWIRFDRSLTKEGADFILGVLCFWYAFRLMRWVSVTINQICERLGIYCLTLKKRKIE